MSDRTIRKASKNANKHSERGLTALRASMQQDGWIGAMTTAALHAQHCAAHPQRDFER